MTPVGFCSAFSFACPCHSVHPASRFDLVGSSCKTIIPLTLSSLDLLFRSLLLFYLCLFFGLSENYCRSDLFSVCSCALTADCAPVCCRCPDDDAQCTMHFSMRQRLEVSSCLEPCTNIDMYERFLCRRSSKNSDWSSFK